MIEKDRQKAGQEILGIRKASLYPKSGSWNCHGVTESTEPVEKRAPFHNQMLYPHPEGNNFSRPLKVSLLICRLCGLGASVANCRF
ncbi:MAG: hypothetical protein DMG05_28125 [Acidobacteria bacterium]|nr:MAG: hypothetical protein DMG05_28125 [Acidobacteriota bacterium]